MFEKIVIQIKISLNKKCLNFDRALLQQFAIVIKKLEWNIGAAFNINCKFKTSLHIASGVTCTKLRQLGPTNWIANDSDSKPSELERPLSENSDCNVKI